jgi:hypothetical protein
LKICLPFFSSNSLVASSSPYTEKFTAINGMEWIAARQKPTESNLHAYKA